MKKWTTLDRALIPDGQTITLEEHDGSYTIRIDGVPLMTTRQHGSEDKLAVLACAHVSSKPGARALIGGLGFGFTLKAALAVLPANASVVVAELLSSVIEWNRNPAYPLAAAAMSDPRVKILHRDVVDVIREQRGGFDSIMMDVDNGPNAFTTDGNSRLYDPAGLRSIRAALRPAGCVTFWSVAPDPAFPALLTRAGFTATVHAARAHGNSGRRHTIFVGKLAEPTADW